MANVPLSRNTRVARRLAFAWSLPLLLFPNSPVHFPQALSMVSVSKQAAYTSLPIARKIRGEWFEKFLKRCLCLRFAKLQETLDFNFYLYRILAIPRNPPRLGPTTKMLFKLQKTAKYKRFQGIIQTKIQTGHQIDPAGGYLV